MILRFGRPKMINKILLFKLPLTATKNVYARALRLLCYVHLRRCVKLDALVSNKQNIGVGELIKIIKMFYFWRDSSGLEPVWKKLSFFLKEQFYKNTRLIFTQNLTTN